MPTNASQQESPAQPSADAPAFRPGQGTPLLDGITLDHGPRSLLGQFFLLADAQARRAGVRLQLHRDLAGLIAVNRAAGSAWGAPMVPILDPAHSRLTPDTAFWISGHDSTGRVVATQAARLVTMEDTTLRDEMESLRLFYADPGPHLAAGAQCEVDCPPAEHIRGRVVYSGGAWYHPEFRKRGLSGILPRISRNLAYTTWRSDYTTSVVERVLAEKGMPRVYGYSKHQPQIWLRRSYREDLDLQLIWMDAEELLRDLSTYVAASMNEVRSTEEVDTKLPRAVRQGSIRRS